MKKQLHLLAIIAMSLSSVSVFAQALDEPADSIISDLDAIEYQPMTVSAPTPVSGATPNPYAYGVRGSWNDDILTVHYSLNAKASKVYVVFKIGGLEVERVELTGATASESSAVSAGSHSRTVNTTILGKGYYDWEIEVVPVNRSATQCVKMYRFVHPQGVDVVTDPTNPYFGYVLVSEGRHGSGSTYHSGTSGSGSGQGLYVFDPQINGVLNPVTAKYGFKGGVADATTVGAVSSGSNRGMSPRKVRIAEDGRVFITTQANQTSPLYIVPDMAALLDCEDWINAFPGLTWDASNYCYKRDGSFICGPNVGLALDGKGANMKVCLLSGEGSSFFNDGATGAAYGNSHVRIYDFGSRDQWSGDPADLVPAEGTAERAISAAAKFANSHVYGNIEYDPNGGLWFSQKLSSTSSSGPYGVASVNKYGETTFSRNSFLTGGGGIRLSPDKSMVVFNRSNTTFGVSVIKGYDNAGTGDFHPVMSSTPEYQVAHGMGASVNDFAWDVADNIYAVDNESECLAVYALPTNKTVVTPAPEGSGFKIDHIAVRPMPYWTGTPEEDPEKLNSFAFNVKSDIDYDTDEFIVTYSLNAPAKSVTLTLINENGTQYEEIIEEASEEGLIDPDGYLTTGEHTFRLSNHNYATGIYNWRVDVENFPYNKVYLTHKIEFYRPFGIEVINNPYSSKFGRIMICEGYTPPESKRHANGNPYHGNNHNYQGYDAGGTSGLFMWNPDFTPIVNQKTGKLAFTGGLNVSEEAYNVGHNLTDGCVPLRIRANDDASRIFVTTQSNLNAPIYELPGFDALEDGDDWDQFVEGHWDTNTPRTYQWMTPGDDEHPSEVMMGVNVGFDILGTGDNMKMLIGSAYDELLKDPTFRVSHTMAGEFNVGTRATWDGPASNVVDKLNGQYLSHYSGANVAYDKRGGVWFNQGRAHQVGIDAANTIFCYFSNRGEYYREEAPSSDRTIRHAGGGIRLSPDHKRMAISSGVNKNGKITVYNLEYSDDDVPTITPQFDIDVEPVMGAGVTDIAWDLADNLYVTSRYGEYAAVYSLPRASSVASTSASTIFAIVSSEVGSFTGMEQIPDAAARPAVNVTTEHGAILVNGQWQHAQVYDLAGRRIASLHGSQGRSHAQTSVARGVYIVVVDETSYKVIVK